MAHRAENPPAADALKSVWQRPLLLEAIGEIALLAAAGLLLAWLGMLRLSHTGMIAAGLSYAMVSVLVLAGLSRHAHSHFGWANVITLCRAAFAVLLLAVAAEALMGETRLLSDPAYRWGLTIGAVIALILDGLDGWAARYTGMASEFGSRFDMETDALFLLALTVLIAVSGIAGPWILLSGVMYYLFRIAGWAWPILMSPLPPSLRRKAVCVAQAALLIAALAPAVPPRAALFFCAAGLALQISSFAIDTIRLLAKSR